MSPSSLLKKTYELIAKMIHVYLTKLYSDIWYVVNVDCRTNVARLLGQRRNAALPESFDHMYFHVSTQRFFHWS